MLPGPAGNNVAMMPRRPYIFLTLFLLSSLPAFPADGTAPRTATVVRFDDPFHDPYRPAELHAVPGNLRRIGQFHFGQQPFAHENPLRNEWLTLKYFFGIKSDIDLRPSHETGHRPNEGHKDSGYVKRLAAWWEAEQFKDPDHLYSFPESRPFRFYQDNIAVLDGTPLDSGGMNGPWNFRRAKRLLSYATETNACPMFIHCNAGEGRTGTALAIIAYSIYGVSMDAAILLARHEDGTLGPGEIQVKFLKAFAAAHPFPGFFWPKVHPDCIRQ